MKFIPVLVAGPSRWSEPARRCFEAESDIRVVAHATDTRPALEAARLHRPTVVLVDHALMRGDSPPILRGLRQVSPRIRVLAITPDVDDAFALHVVRQGGHGTVEEAALLASLAKAVRAVSAGQVWLTRAQEELLLTALRQSHVASTPASSRAIHHRSAGRRRDAVSR